MGLFLVWRHRLICIVVSLCKHAYKDVCDVKPGIDPYPLLARLCNKWWSDFVTFTACKKSRLGLKRRNALQTGAKIYLSEKIFWGWVTVIIHGHVTTATQTSYVHLFVVTCNIVCTDWIFNFLKLISAFRMAFFKRTVVYLPRRHLRGGWEEFKWNLREV